MRDISAGSRSTTVTSSPFSRATEAISSPMKPPPISARLRAFASAAPMVWASSSVRR